MKPLLRIVWKDFLALRGRLALWSGAMLLKSGLGIWLLHGPVSADGAERIGAAMGVIAVLELALTFLLAGLLVQADPLVGEQAFWRTRPISGRRLLGAKILGAALLLGVPVVLTALPWWIACAARPLDLAVAAAWLAAIQIAVALPAMLVAALTPSAGRFLVGAVLMLFVVMTTLSTWLPAAGAKMDLTRGVVLLGGWLVVGAIVIAAQYARVGLVRALGGLGAGGALVFAVAAWAPLPAWDRSPMMPERNAARAAGLTMRIVDTKVTVPAQKRGPAGIVWTRVEFEGVPAGLEPGFYATHHVWTWEDGTISEVRGFPMFRRPGLLNNARRGLGVPERPTNERVEAWVHIDAPLRERIAAGAKSYAVTAHVGLMRSRPLGGVPVRAGAAGAWAGRGLRLLTGNLPRTEDSSRSSAAITTEFASVPGGVLTGMGRSVARFSLSYFPRYLLIGEGRQWAATVDVRGGPEMPFAGVFVALRSMSELYQRPAGTSGEVSVAVLEWEEEAAVVRTATHAP